MYLANKLSRDLDTHFSAKEFCGKKVPYGAISRAMNKVLMPMGARCKITKDEHFRKKPPKFREPFTVSGVFHLGKKRDAIQINLHFSPLKRKFMLTPRRYRQLKFMVSQVVQHEFIHKSQFTFRPEQAERSVKVHLSEKLPQSRMSQIAYLSENCEIEAFAHDIAMEIKFFYSNERPDRVIKNIDQRTRLTSFVAYKKAFKGTNWDRLRKTLLRKVWRWMPVAQH